ncbi:MAG: hypothetical protein EOP48_27895 [Sphingobacteriales bacterium]|nr:MAG: hypothetical protein EOP48_27895 [Sphingobacteriales bacterium]
MSHTHVLNYPLFTQEVVSSLDAKEDEKSLENEIEAQKIKVIDNEAELNEVRTLHCEKGGSINTEK